MRAIVLNYVYAGDHPNDLIKVKWLYRRKEVKITSISRRFSIPFDGEPGKRRRKKWKLFGTFEISV